MAAADRPAVEVPTLLLIVVCYLAWLVGIGPLAHLWLPAAVTVTGVAIALHSSLTHEIVHGHPFRNARLNALMVAPALGLLVPYRRFRDTHLAHHVDSRLTDPYDDPESNYLDPATWQRLPAPIRFLLRINNTLLGRIVVGPLIGQIAFMRSDWCAWRAGDQSIARAWILHIPAVILVIAIVNLSAMPLWAYFIAAYIGHGLLRIRTFLEHQAHHHTAGRTVIIEDRGPLALLFLNNNLHIVHHMHPNVPWYDLPALYASRRVRYQKRNQGYVYRSYGQIFARHLIRAKDPVPHPLWPQFEPGDQGVTSTRSPAQREMSEAIASVPAAPLPQRHP